MTDLKKLRELAVWSMADLPPSPVIRKEDLILAKARIDFCAAANPQAIIEVLDRLERYREALIEFADYDNQYEPNMVCWPASDYMRKAREALEGGK